jgi:hypothetical protein
MVYIDEGEVTDRLAIWCVYLRRTIQSGRLDGPVVTLCTHPIRDGFDCIGPFMEDLPTSCGLWQRSTSAPPVVAR